MFRTNNLSALILALTVFAPQMVHASVSTVSSIAVNKGQLTTQLRASYSEDAKDKALNHRLRTRVATDYGFTDSFAIGIHFQGDNRGNDTQQHDATLMEARFQLADAKTDGYYGGFRLRYTLRDGDKKPDNAHIRLIAGVPMDRWDMRVNQTFAYEVGEDRKGGIGVDTRLQATYVYYPNHRAGIESFSDFGYGTRLSHFDQQNHSIGPVFIGNMSDDMSYEAGYRYGLSDAAADHMVKFFITRIF